MSSLFSVYATTFYSVVAVQHCVCFFKLSFDTMITLPVCYPVMYYYCLFTCLMLEVTISASLAALLYLSEFIHSDDNVFFIILFCDFSCNYGLKFENEDAAQR